MKKYFVVSDIHGFYDEFIFALDQSGFDIYNKDHILIILGDIFDRGNKPLEIYHYLRAFPEDRLILVKGNHESLLLELIETKVATARDYHNGTYKTLVSLYKDPAVVSKKWLMEHYKEYEWSEAIRIAKEISNQEEAKLYDNDVINEIIEWLNSPCWKEYYELGKYIFVHSFIPLQITDYQLETVRYNPDWRINSTKEEYDFSRWGCPYKLYLAGLFSEEEKQGKILVCGHWHTSDFYNQLIYKNEPEKQLNIYESNPIFKSDKYPGLIAIDACTAATHEINVLIINEDEI